MADNCCSGTCKKHSDYDFKTCQEECRGINWICENNDDCCSGICKEDSDLRDGLKTCQEKGIQ